MTKTTMELIDSLEIIIVKEVVVFLTNLHRLKTLEVKDPHHPRTQEARDLPSPLVPHFPRIKATTDDTLLGVILNRQDLGFMIP